MAAWPPEPGFCQWLGAANCNGLLKFPSILKFHRALLSVQYTLPKESAIRNARIRKAEVMDAPFVTFDLM